MFLCSLAVACPLASAFGKFETEGLELGTRPVAFSRLLRQLSFVHSMAPIRIKIRHRIHVQIVKQQVSGIDVCRWKKEVKRRKRQHCNPADEHGKVVPSNRGSEPGVKGEGEVIITMNVDMAGHACPADEE